MPADHSAMAAEKEPVLSENFRKIYQQGLTSKRVNINPMASDVGKKKFGFEREEFDDRTGFYEGKYKVWMRHGPGALIETGVSAYVGQFRNEKMHGDGNKSWTDGSSYRGQWKDGKKHGHGSFSSGKTSFSGRWREGLRHGEGTQNFANGDSYHGTYWGGLCSGLGTQHFEDGSQYVGGFAGGRHNGGGLFYGADNTRERHTFDQGVLMKREILRPAQVPTKFDRARPVVHVALIEEEQSKTEMMQDTIRDSGKPHFPHITVKESTTMDLSAPSIRKQIRSARGPRSAAAIPRWAFDEMSSQEISVCDSTQADQEVSELIGVADLPDRMMLDLHHSSMQIREDAFGCPGDELDQTSAGGSLADFGMSPRGSTRPGSALAVHA
eukprot:TRINITY_DN104984_c0_g1_i1.p1 TRINITY_DN104984_c0_g1~~TRINITY_DN104984_c0_g1_i1.p1  ORF type:complete len:382 (+),score=72.00 TRINITY_DN104984_c0_g1_i1:76-1221(+)